MHELKTGDAAPDFELESSDGGKVSSKDFIGKKLVLYFYPKDNTSGCTIEACGFRDLQGEFAAEDTVIIGVSPDGIKSHGNFSSKYNLNFPLLSDTEHKAAEAYGVWALKKMYGREYYGLVRSTFVIDREGKLAHIFRKVKVAGHMEEVLESVKKMD